MMSGIVEAWLNKDALGKTGNRYSVSAIQWEGRLRLRGCWKAGCAWEAVGRGVAPGTRWEGSFRLDTWAPSYNAILQNNAPGTPGAPDASGRTERTFCCC